MTRDRELPCSTTLEPRKFSKDQTWLIGLGGPDVETADVVPGARSMNFYSVVSVGHGRTGDSKDSVYRTTDKRL